MRLDTSKSRSNHPRLSLIVVPLHDSVLEVSIFSAPSQRAPHHLKRQLALMDHGQNQQFNTQSHQCRGEVLAESRNHDLQAVISYQLSLQTESLYREEILQHLEHMQVCAS